MSTLPGDASPPKSGCNRRVPPLLMNAMKLAEFGSTGAAEMFVFHQLSAGKTGSGPDGAAPSTGTVGGHCANAVAAAMVLNSRANNRRFVDIWALHDRYAVVIVRHDPACAKSAHRNGYCRRQAVRRDRDAFDSVSRTPLRATPQCRVPTPRARRRRSAHR